MRRVGEEERRRGGEGVSRLAAMSGFGDYLGPYGDARPHHTTRAPVVSELRGGKQQQQPRTKSRTRAAAICEQRRQRQHRRQPQPQHHQLPQSP